MTQQICALFLMFLMFYRIRNKRSLGHIVFLKHPHPAPMTASKSRMVTTSVWTAGKSLMCGCSEMTAIDLFQQLRVLGVLLTLSADGTIHAKASHGALAPDMREAMRTHKDELLTLLQQETAPAAAADPIIPGPWTGPGFGGPCYVCGIEDRWQDKYGILRCRACWPPTPDRRTSPPAQPCMVAGLCKWAWMAHGWQC